jgi:murein DD-endopeptidase MepM/ murein hydrolase activator NlpD
MTALPDSSNSPVGRSRRHRRARRVAGTALLLAGLVASSSAAVPAAGAATGITAADAATGITAADASHPATAREDAPQWLWPVAPPIVVEEPFRAPPTPYAAGHRGIDVAAEPGATVVAPAAGVVSFAGPVAGRGVVAIDHGDGVVSAIEPVQAVVAAGTTVVSGDVIGTVASGGHCDAVCVHFGVRVDGEYVSPFLFLGGLPRAVLLPMQ